MSKKRQTRVYSNLLQNSPKLDATVDDYESPNGYIAVCSPMEY